MKTSRFFLPVASTVLVATLCVGAWAANDQPAEKGSIKGKVTYGTPVPNVTVTLQGPANDEAKTDEKGEFAFNDLPPGEYTLEADGIAKNARRKGTKMVKMPSKPVEKKITIELK